MHLIRHYFETYPEDTDKVVLSIKGAVDHTRSPTGSPDAIRASVEGALAVLAGSKTIDVFEMARVDPKVPIETSVKALAELVNEGKIGGVGLSEVNAATIRRAHAVHPIAAVEIELSLFTPDPLHNGIMDTCHECKSISTYFSRLKGLLMMHDAVNIPVLGYSPVGRGWLTGKYRKKEDVAAGSLQTMFEQFKPEVFDQNYKRVEAVEKVATRKNLKTSQVAIAWAAHKGAIPIPGSTNIERVALNSWLAELTEEDVLELDEAVKSFPIAGARYGGAHEAFLNG